MKFLGFSVGAILRRLAPSRKAALFKNPFKDAFKALIRDLNLMRLHLSAALALALGLGAAAGAGADNSTLPPPPADLGLPPALTEALQGIDAGRISAHVRFLADDALEGRGPGVRGGDIAAKYIASQFAQYGLKPAGDNGGYFQNVDFVGVLTQPATSFALQPASGNAVQLKLRDDFVVNDQAQGETADIDAPVVFVGYGIEAPEYQWDDYKGVDVKGKVVLIIVNQPPSTDPKFFNGGALTYYGRWTYKFEEAARKGAIGAMIIHRTDLASYPWEVVRSSWSNEQVYLADDKDPKLQAASWIQLEVARLLFAAAGLKLEDEFAAANSRDFKPVELPVNLVAHIASRVRKFSSNNVLAMLPGADAEPPRQAVIYTAHYDHLGIDPSLPGDSIYNGAVDNGTGCGMLLELAHAYAGAKQKPPHPIYFAAVTGEEKGLLGSNYLGKHPPLPAAQLALDLNFDAILPIGTPESVTVGGAERTSFYPVVQKTAAAFHLEIEPDANPGAGEYYRSDHFSFARAGVPAFSVGAGVKYAGHTPDWGKAIEDDYTANRYHRPTDEYTADMDFSSNAILARFGLALGWQASAAPDTVSWKPGDEFEAARQRSLKAQ
jgi:Zn-dependent M28 family amino/carboxypeptidase